MFINQNFDNVDGPNDISMLEYFNKNISGNFILRSFLNQMMDAGRDINSFNRVKLSCKQIKIKNDTKVSAGY
jgi:hypothetical protein